MNSAAIINIDDRAKDALSVATKLFFEGKVFIYPTDTLYGFGGNPFNEEVISRIVKVKHLNDANTFVLLVNSIEMLMRYIEIQDDRDIELFPQIWPGPISLRFRLNGHASAVMNTDKAIFRMPNHSFCKKLIDSMHLPILATGVYRSGEAPLEDYITIRQEFLGDIDALFYTEAKCYNVSSTLIDFTTPTPELLREGKVKFNDFNKIYRKFREES